MTHRRVVERREHEDDPHLFQHLRLTLRWQVQPNAERLEHVCAAAPGCEAPVPVLCDGHPRAGGEEGGSRGDVEGGDTAAARAAGVHDRLLLARRNGYHRGTKRPDASGDLLGHRSADPHRDQKRRHLNGRGAALHHLGEGGLRLLEGQGSFGHRPDQHLQRHHRFRSCSRPRASRRGGVIVATAPEHCQSPQGAQKPLAPLDIPPPSATFRRHEHPGYAPHLPGRAVRRSGLSRLAAAAVGAQRTGRDGAGPRQGLRPPGARARLGADGSGRPRHRADGHGGRPRPMGRGRAAPGAEPPASAGDLDRGCLAGSESLSPAIRRNHALLRLPDRTAGRRASPPFTGAGAGRSACHSTSRGCGRSTAAIPGEHSFRAFAKAGQEKRGDRCIVSEARWVEWEGMGVQLHITANRFLHHMVRYLVGTLVAVGTGRRPGEDVPALLQGADGRLTSPPAPPEGLFLTRVSYPPPPYGPPERAEAGGDADLPIHL